MPGTRLRGGQLVPTAPASQPQAFLPQGGHPVLAQTANQKLADLNAAAQVQACSLAYRTPVVPPPSPGPLHMPNLSLWPGAPQLPPSGLPVPAAPVAPVPVPRTAQGIPVPQASGEPWQPDTPAFAPQQQQQQPTLAAPVPWYIAPAIASAPAPAERPASGPLPTPGGGSSENDHRRSTGWLLSEVAVHFGPDHSEYLRPLHPGPSDDSLSDLGSEDSYDSAATAIPGKPKKSRCSYCAQRFPKEQLG